MDNVRNKEGIFINTEIFREEGKHFNKYGYYCADPDGSPSWYDYWLEQKRRCLYGYESGGTKITGDNYHYLNFCPIKKVDKDSIRGKKARKIIDFPDFWDGDYNYFWVREIARNGILDAFDIPNEEQENILKLHPDVRNETFKFYWDKLGLIYKPVIEDLVGGKDLIVGKGRRRGFEQPNSEIVMTPIGETTMGELKVGDEVLTPTGKAKVLEVYPQGIKDVYEITLLDGRKVKCGLNHLWKIYNSKNNKVIVNTKFLLENNLKVNRLYNNKDKSSYNYKLPITNEVSYNIDNKLPIDPYLLGLLIGDGSFTQGSCLFSTIDLELLDYIKDILGEDYEIKQKTATQYSIVYTKDRTNPISVSLKNLGLKCTAKYKFIPDIYKYSSIENRYKLIKGLMDTDGSIWKSGSCNFVNTSERLIDDLAYILRSLGIRVKKSGGEINKGFSINPSWILIITTTKQIFNLKRKQDKVRLERKVDTINKIPIIKVEKLEYQEESSCILIDSDDHLYLTKDFIVTHNSYKNASIGVKNFFHKPKSYTMYMAYEKKYLYPGQKTIFGKTLDYINFINSHTAWTQPSDAISRLNHIKASYIEYRNGKPIEKGFLSEIEAISFKDNPDAGRGADSEDIFGEEVGAWGVPGGLKNTVAAMRSSSEAGDFKTGMITLFGTSGAMEDGTVDFADLFDRPSANNFMAFYDIWGDFPEKREGFFFPKQLNTEGFYNEQGNSDIKAAKEAELLTRANLIKNGATSTEIRKRMQEESLNSSEAFSLISMNDFPIVELESRRKIIIAKDLDRKKGIPVKMYYGDGGLKVEPVLNGSVQPIMSFRDIPFDIKGIPVIYEPPIENAPKGLYKIGYDPYRQDQGSSLAAIIVYKSKAKDSYTHSTIVAIYVGRMKEAEDVDRIAEMFADYYNTTIMHENEVTSVKNYFRRVKRLNLLAAQPDTVISKNIKNSHVARIYGCHMVDQLKDAGERYVKQWLTSTVDFDEFGNKITVIDRIYSLRLIEELIAYHRKGNFDLVSALFMCMFQVQEEVLGKEYGSDRENKKFKDLSKMWEEMQELQNA